MENLTFNNYLIVFVLTLFAGLCSIGTKSCVFLKRKRWYYNFYCYSVIVGIIIYISFDEQLLVQEYMEMHILQF